MTFCRRFVFQDHNSRNEMWFACSLNKVWLLFSFPPVGSDFWFCVSSEYKQATIKKKKKVRTLPDSKKQKCARLSLFWGHLLPTHPAAWQHYIISQKKQKLAEMLHHSQFVRTDSPLCPIRQTETLQPHDEGVFSFWGNHNTILEVRLHQYIKLRPSGERGMKDKRERPVVMQRRTQKQTAVLPT